MAKVISRRYPNPFSLDYITCLPSSIRNILSGNVTAKVRAAIWITLSMAIHLGGYEFARNATVSMFTSKDFGFESPAVVPLGVGCVCPFSIFLLFSFAGILKRHGPRRALLRSTLTCTFVTAFIALALSQINRHNTARGMVIPKMLLFFQFVFQSSYVQFLYTQHMSFIGSILNPDEGKIWFAPIAGVASIISTISAGSISYLVDILGLTGLLLSASVTIGLSGILGNVAYGVAARNGFEPTHEPIDEENSEKDTINRSSKNAAIGALALLRRVPPLGALFCEVMLAQAFSSLLNFLFLLKVKSVIKEDEARASFTGKRYAWINGVSGLLQFFVIPIMTKKIEIRWLWLLMPFTMLCSASMQWYEPADSITIVSLSFSIMKIMEYSVRAMTTEMLYVSLDYESRFIGKEVINLCAGRFGKSGIAVFLFLLSSLWVWGDGELENILSLLLTFTAVTWLFATLRLTRLLPLEIPPEKNCNS